MCNVHSTECNYSSVSTLERGQKRNEIMLFSSLRAVCEIAAGFKSYDESLATFDGLPFFRKFQGNLCLRVLCHLLRYLNEAVGNWRQVAIHFLGIKKQLHSPEKQAIAFKCERLTVR